MSNWLEAIPPSRTLILVKPMQIKIRANLQAAILPLVPYSIILSQLPKLCLSQNSYNSLSEFLSQIGGVQNQQESMYKEPGIDIFFYAGMFLQPVWISKVFFGFTEQFFQNYYCGMTICSVIEARQGFWNDVLINFFICLQYEDICIEISKLKDNYDLLLIPSLQRPIIIFQFFTYFIYRYDTGSMCIIYYFEMRIQSNYLQDTIFDHRNKTYKQFVSKLHFMGSRPPAKVYSIETPGQQQPSNSTKILRNPKYATYLWSSPQSEVRSVREMLNLGFKNFANKKCLGTIHQKDGTRVIQFLTYGQVQMMINSIARIIIDLKLANDVQHTREKNLTVIGICSKNRYQWLVTAFACIIFGITLVPIYPNQEQDQILYILNHSGVHTVFCSGQIVTFFSKIKKIGRIRTIVSFDSIGSQQQALFQLRDIKILQFSTLLAEGLKKPPYNSPQIVPTHCMILTYTSGTTGTPKGVMVSHLNMASCCSVIKAGDDTRVFDTDVHFSYMPLAHVAEQTTLIIVVSVGGLIVFYCGDFMRFREDVQLIRPTSLLGPPRIFNILYEGFQNKFLQVDGCKKSILDAGLLAKTQNLLSSGECDHFFYDKLIFDKIKEIVGGKVRTMISGGDHMDPDVQNFMRVVFGVPLLMTYGLTESTQGSFITDAIDPTSGHVGGPTVIVIVKQSNTQFKLVDIPELHYTHQDRDKEGRLCPRGEIYLRGPGIFKGYFRDFDRTKEVLTEEGWFKTGDIGMILPENGALRILGRKTSIIRLKNSESILPQKIQNILIKKGGISEICICHWPGQLFIVCIIVPKKNAIQIIGKIKGIQESFEILCANQIVKKQFLNQLLRFGYSRGLTLNELPKNIHFSVKSFEQMKLKNHRMSTKRYMVNNIYEQQIIGMYKQGRILDRQQIYILQMSD